MLLPYNQPSISENLCKIPESTSDYCNMHDTKSSYMYYVIIDKIVFQLNLLIYFFDFESDLKNKNVW